MEAAATLEQCVCSLEAMAADATQEARHSDLLGAIERSHRSIDLHLGAGSGQMLDRGRQALVLLCIRVAPSTDRGVLRAVDIAELVGGPRNAAVALVGLLDAGFVEKQQLAAALADCALPTAYVDEEKDNLDNISTLAKRFAIDLSYICEEAVHAKLWKHDDDDVVFAHLLRLLSNLLQFSTNQGNLRQHIVDDCPRLVSRIIKMLERCLGRLAVSENFRGVGIDVTEAWTRATLAVQVLATLTFHLRPLRREVCAGDPTTSFLRAMEANNRQCGLGAIVALLLKLKVNIEGGDGDWRSQAKRNAGRMADLVKNLSATSQKQFARALSLHDATPINRSSRAWPIFLAVVDVGAMAKSLGRRRDRQTSPRLLKQTNLDNFAESKDEAKGSPDAKRSARRFFFNEEDHRHRIAVREDDANATPPPSPGAKGCASPLTSLQSPLTPTKKRMMSPMSSINDHKLSLPHHLPPLRRLMERGATPPSEEPPPQQYLCSLTGELMKEPIAIPGDAQKRKVDRSALCDYVETLEPTDRTWPITNLPLKQPIGELLVDLTLANEIQLYRFARVFHHHQ